MKVDMIRSFVALELPDSMHRQLREQISSLRRLLPEGSIRWVRPESIHLTLKFLGDISPERVEPITSMMQGIVSGYSPFDFQVGEFGCFPNRRRPRVLWVGVQEPSGLLAALQEDLERGFEALGFEPEKRAFHPHLTLGRLHRRVGSSELRAVSETLEQVEIGALGKVKVEAVNLMRSDLQPGGAVYSRLSQVVLEGAS